MEEKEFEAKLRSVNEVKTDQIKKMCQICAFYAFSFGCSVEYHTFALVL